MSYLASLIAERIRTELSLSIGKERDASSLRIFFSGPPFSILDATYRALLSSGDKLILDIDGEVVSIPVFLLKSDVPDPKGKVTSSVCTENYFVAAVRNNPAIPKCLVLQNHISSVKSVDTTVTRLGGHLDVREFDNWYDSIWIQHIINEFVLVLPADIDKNCFLNAIKHTLKLSWDLESDKREKNLVWATLESISSLFSNESQEVSVSSITRCLGLASCDHGTFGSTLHLALNEKITEFFESKGLSSGLDLLMDKADENIKLGLKGFKDALVKKEIIQASDLSDVGLHTLYGKSLAGPEIPTYWGLLTLEVWRDLLDEDDITQKDGIALQVEAVDTLLDAQNGFPNVSQDHVAFKIFHNYSDNLEIQILRSVGSSKYTILNSIQLSPSTEHLFLDSSVPDHQTHVRYGIRVVGDDASIVTLKWIVLDFYGPGLTVVSRAAKKLKPFKLNKRASSLNGLTVERYECELSFASMGQFQIEFLHASDIALPNVITGYEVDSEHSDEVSCTVSADGICLIQTDEECYYDFTIKRVDNRESLFRLHVLAEDTPPKGVPTEFDRLIESHLGGGQAGITAKVEAIKGRLYDLELQILDQPELSHRPVIVGPDYITSWSKIDWRDEAKVSNLGLMHDLRPDNWERLVPRDFLDARKAVLKWLQQESDGIYGVAELRLHELSDNKEFKTALVDFVQAYSDWLSDDYEHAVWVDTVSFFNSQPGSHGLSAKPYAVLLSPFHPIKLSYQFEAQKLMFDAIARHEACPAVSLFTPACFPDVLCLQYRTVSGSLDSIDLISVQSSNPYWGVFWSIDEVGRADYGKLSMGLSDGFQLGLRGLTTGFTTQQMVRSLGEVTKLLSGKTSLAVQLYSDTGGDSDCNAGIQVWSNDRLLSENDLWSESGALRVQIFDRRPVDMQPEQSTLAALTQTTGSRIQWHTNSDQSVFDLSVIASLNATQPEFHAQGITSAVDKLGLSRSRIRKRLQDHYLAESLVMERVDNVQDSLISKMLDATLAIEQHVADNGHDGFLFAPNVYELAEVVKDAKYTAVSSSNIDFQSFAEIGAGKSFLWDYELPSYSRSVGGADGYYLLATHSEAMNAAVRTALKEFSGVETNLNDTAIKSLLAEVSRRGMPTLKRLTGGGTHTMGELGMLAAVRLLQPDFLESFAGVSIFPIKGGQESLCLLVPVDPFQAHIDSLRKSFHKRTGERPDLLAISLAYSSKKLNRIKLTAVEVKARRGELGTKGRSAAISQASHFSTFLRDLRDKGITTEIWGLAWRALLISLIDYSFRVYSSATHILDPNEWFELHSTAIHEIARGDVDVQIDGSGRLVSIENTEKPSYLDSYDGDRFDETIVLNHADAVGVIEGKDSQFSQAVTTKLGSWNLLPSVEAVASTENDQDDSSDLPKTVHSVGQRNREEEPFMKIASLETGLRFDVGQTIGQIENRRLEFYPANTALNQLNVGIVGDLGTGKTQLIKSLIYQLTSNAHLNRGAVPNILIFDYKRDYSNADFAKATRAKVVSPYEIPLNIFDIPNTVNKQRAQHERGRFFIDVLDKIYSGIGPVQKEHIKSAVKLAYKKLELTKKSPTLKDVFDCYKEEGRIDSPYSIMSDLVDSEYFVDRSEEVIPFSEFLSGVVVVDLSQILADADKNMLVAIFLNLFYEYMLGVEKKPFVGTSPSLRFVDTMLLVDEADNIMKYEFEVLRKILLQGREFGVGVLLASQYLSHFKTRNQNYLEPLLTWFIHKVPSITARELESIGITSDLEQMATKIRRLECHQCLYKSLGVQGDIMRGTPFFELLDNLSDKS